MEQFLVLIRRLSPSKQRLVREFIWNLAQLERLTIPEDHDARLDYQAYVGSWLESLIAKGYSKETIRHHPAPAFSQWRVRSFEWTLAHRSLPILLAVGCLTPACHLQN